MAETAVVAARSRARLLPLAVYYVSWHEKSYAVVLSMRIVPDGTRHTAVAQALQQSSVRYEL